jgi:ABC-type maltose transport system permease subunit
MNVLLCIIIQILVWCGYSLVLYLSHHDHSFYETVLLVMFSYFNFLIAVRFIPKRTTGVNLTILFTVIYIAGRIVFL